MQTKTLELLLQEANNEIKRLSFEESLSIINELNTIIIDVREESEVNNSGMIKNAIHIPRGLLEFWLHPESSFIEQKEIDLDKEIVLFCAAGGRSALAAKTLKDMGFEKVSHVAGGYSLMKDSGFKTK